MLRKGMFLADRYEIIDQIGTGGMSDVYKAKCHKLNRFVAIKVLKEEFSNDKNFVSKFRIEAQSAAGLTHPNVVNVYDVGDENGVYYIVMELVEGITLKRYIEKKGRLGNKEAVSIAIQVAQGIEAAHRHHIIHRDIKPQNVIISKDGKVKVTDFGIARAATSNTINSSAMGSVHYISPEQARGGYSDERSDIYSFGITLYEMLTGTVPFDGDTTVSVALQHIQEEIAAPSTAADGIPVSVDKIVVKCTQKKVERRYQNLTELIVDLKKSLVMPDVDFVVINSGFTATAPVNEEDQDEAVLTDMVVNPELDEIDLLDEDDESEDDDDILNEESEDDDEDDDDIEDGGNEKLDKAMKWIGIGIVGIIVIIAIVLVVKLAGVLNGSDKTDNTTTAAATSSVQASTVDESNLVTVPNVTTKGNGTYYTVSEAADILKAAGLGYIQVLQPSKIVPKDSVVSQGQLAGSKVAKNSTITLSVSNGIATFTVPNVVGAEEAAAVAKLTEAGLIVTADYQFSDTVAMGMVISTTPKANTTVTASDPITVVVSRGKEVKAVAIPDVYKKTESDARIALSNAGFKNVKLGDSANSSTVPSGSVISLNYATGASVSTDTEIIITLSKGPEQTTGQSTTKAEATTSAQPTTKAN